jgi:hypothetical protein
MPLRLLHRYAGLARDRAAASPRGGTVLAGMTLVVIGILIGWSVRGLLAP